MNTNHRSATQMASVAVVVTCASLTGRYGGPYEVARSLAAVFAKLDWRVVLLAQGFSGDTPKSERGRQTSFVYVPGVALASAPFVTLFSWRFSLFAIRRIRKFDLIHLSLAREAGVIFVACVALITRRRLVVQPHGMLTSGSGPFQRLVDSLFIRPICRRADMIFALTEREREDLARRLRLPEHSISVLGNPPPPDLDVPVQSLRKKQAVFAARLHPRKRVEVVLAAAQLSARFGWMDSYVIAGADEGDVRHVRDAQAVWPNISYLGALAADAANALVAASAVFVLASHEEPWGMALVQALRSGTVPVLTASSALAPIIELENAGVVVPDSDPDALASAVHVLLTDSIRWQEYSDRAKALFDTRFSASVFEMTLAQLLVTIK